MTPVLAKEINSVQAKRLTSGAGGLFLFFITHKVPNPKANKAITSPTQVPIAMLWVNTTFSSIFPKRATAHPMAGKLNI